MKSVFHHVRKMSHFCFFSFFFLSLLELLLRALFLDLFFFFEIVDENSIVKRNFGFHILAGILIRAKYCWKRMKEITAEIKFLAGVKNQCSVRKAGIGKPEQGVRQNSSKNFWCSATFQQKSNSAGKSLFQRNIRRTEQALILLLRNYR